MRRFTFVLLFVTGALGCGARETSDRPRLWTLFDFARLAGAGQNLMAGGLELPATYFVKEVVDGVGPTGRYELAVSSGFVDGQSMKYVTTDVWAHFDKVWVQPMYIGLVAGRTWNDPGGWDDPDVQEPWVFGVGPKSLFYSPFWQVYRFKTPVGVDVATLLDTRAVLEAANQTGGLRRTERRITSLAPTSVFSPNEWDGSTYYDNTGAWDGLWGRRYIDMGPGRFDFDQDGVVREFPIFIFTKKGVPLYWPNVGGTRPLFAAPPALTNARDGGPTDGAADGGAWTAPMPPPVNLNPNFGGLWRMYLVDLPDAAEKTADDRAVLNAACLNGSEACVVLDSQTAIESLGAGRIHRTELLAACPILQLGNLTLPFPLENQPLPKPTSP